MASIQPEKDITPHVIKWIKSVLGNIPVIIDRTNAERPKKPYISLNILVPVQKTGFTDSLESIPPEEAPDGKDTIYNIGGQRQFTMGIRSFTEAKEKNFFDAQNLLIRLQDSIEDDIARQPLTEGGLAVFGSSDILDVTELIESGYEPRAQLDVMMGIASNRQSDQGAIEKVEITGNYTEPTFSADHSVNTDEES